MTDIEKTESIQAKTLHAVLVKGDLESLAEAEKVNHLQAVCNSLGINPLTNPFAYIKMNGKLVLYAKRDATDQLRKIHNVTCAITARDVQQDCYVVSAKATMPNGRTDESVGAVFIGGAKGEALANLYMKAETKAKRRVTLSICGLGFLDETEVETIQDVKAHTVARKSLEPGLDFLRDNLLDIAKNRSWPFEKVTKIIKERYKKLSSKELTEGELVDLTQFLGEHMPFEV